VERYEFSENSRESREDNGDMQKQIRVFHTYYTNGMLPCDPLGLLECRIILLHNRYWPFLFSRPRLGRIKIITKFKKLGKPKEKTDFPLRFFVISPLFF